MFMTFYEYSLYIYNIYITKANLVQTIQTIKIAKIIFSMKVSNDKSHYSFIRF